MFLSQNLFFCCIDFVTGIYLVKKEQKTNKQTPQQTNKQTNKQNKTKQNHYILFTSC